MTKNDKITALLKTLRDEGISLDDMKKAQDAEWDKAKKAAIAEREAELKLATARSKMINAFLEWMRALGMSEDMVSDFSKEIDLKSTIEGAEKSVKGLLTMMHDVENAESEEDYWGALAKAMKIVNSAIETPCVKCGSKDSKPQKSAEDIIKKFLSDNKW